MGAGIVMGFIRIEELCFLRVITCCSGSHNSVICLTRHAVVVL